MKTQRQEVLEHIHEFGGITRATAANHLYVFELSSRIGELEREGDDTGQRWKFERTPVHGKRPGGRKWRVIRYHSPVKVGTPIRPWLAA